MRIMRLGDKKKVKLTSELPLTLTPASDAVVMKAPSASSRYGRAACMRNRWDFTFMLKQRSQSSSSTLSSRSAMLRSLVQPPFEKRTSRRPPRASAALLTRAAVSVREVRSALMAWKCCL